MTAGTFEQRDLKAISRPIWLLLHRYAGLATALFLIVAGLTGTVIAFYEEIDRYLHPTLFKVTPAGEEIPPLALRALAEQLVPQARVDQVALHREPDEAAAFYLQPRTNSATGKPYDLGFDEIFLSPYNGQVLGHRNSSDGILPFIYRLHHSLALPEPWGRWLFGITALIWTFDCFVGFYLTLPVRRRPHPFPLPKGEGKKLGFWRRWKSAWRIKWNGTAYRINFDLHRAAGLWTWAMLFVLALSSVQYNLNDELFAPALRALLPVKDVIETIPPLSTPLDEPQLTWKQALERGRKLMADHAARRHFTIEYEDSLRLDRERGIFVYSVVSSLNIRDRIADTRVLLSAIDGRNLGFIHPYVAAGNAVSQWLGALHTGRVVGLPYRVFLSLMGLVIATLAVTGVIIWWKKRSARLRATKIRLERTT